MVVTVISITTPALQFQQEPILMYHLSANLNVLFTTFQLDTGLDFGWPVVSFST